MKLLDLLKEMKEASLVCRCGDLSFCRFCTACLGDDGKKGSEKKSKDGCFLVIEVSRTGPRLVVCRPTEFGGVELLDDVEDVPKELLVSALKEQGEDGLYPGWYPITKGICEFLRAKAGGLDV